MKYECKSCGLECAVDTNFEPTVCLKTGIICYGWHKVKAPAPEMYSCLEEAIKKVCIDSNCHAYNAGECMNAEGFCRAQKWIKTLKKARGEK